MICEDNSSKPKHGISRHNLAIFISWRTLRYILSVPWKKLFHNEIPSQQIAIGGVSDHI